MKKIMHYAIGIFILFVMIIGGVGQISFNLYHFAQKVMNTPGAVCP